MKLLDVIKARLQLWVDGRLEAEPDKKIMMPALTKRKIRKQLEGLDTRRRKINTALDRSRVKIAASIRQLCKKSGKSPLETQQVLIDAGVIPDCRVETRRKQK